MHPNDVLLDGTRQRVVVYHVVMARRKPSSIVSPWLGASKNIMVAGKTSVNSTGSSEAQIDTGGGERDKVNETLMLGIAGAAGVTAATLGARAVATGRVVNPVAAVRNAVRNEKVVVVGTRAGNSSIVPTVPNVVNVNQQVYPKLKDTPVRWGFDPARTRSARELTESVSDYSNRWLTTPNMGVERLPDGSTRPKFVSDNVPEIVVGRVPKSSVSYEPVMPSWPPTDKQIDALYKIRQGNLSEVNNPSFRSGALASTEPAKIVSRVSPVSNLKTKQLKPVDVLERELVKAIRRAGGKVPKKR